MKLYTVDAFTDVPLGGNPAGVALLKARCRMRRKCAV